MNIRDLVSIWQRYWTLIVSVFALGILASCAALLIVAPRYMADARLFVSNQATGSSTDLLQGSTYTQNRVASYANVATDPIVLDPVIAELGLDATSDELAGRITATTERDSLIINLSAESDSAEGAATLVNAVADTLSTTITDTLERPLAGRDPVVTVTSLKQASAPASPTWPSIPLFLAAGAFAGLLLGISLALIVNALDLRVRTARQVEAIIEAPLLGTIPRTRSIDSDSVIDEATRRSSFGESLRALRTNLTFVDIGGSPRRCILVTSAVPSEGKSTISLTLAASIAGTGKTVILVDADLRASRLSERLGIEAGVGLTDVLLGRASAADLLQPVGTDGTFRILAAGQIPPNPAELLGSSTFEDVLDNLRELADYVIIDAPPVLPVADALVLAHLADGVLFVVGADRVKRPQVANARDALQRVQAPLLGTVVNMVAPSDERGGTYGYRAGAYLDQGSTSSRKAEA